jgi:hypothetical protein
MEKQELVRIRELITTWKRLAEYSRLDQLVGGGTVNELEEGRARGLEQAASWLEYELITLNNQGDT